MKQNIITARAHSLMIDAFNNIEQSFVTPENVLKLFFKVH